MHRSVLECCVGGCANPSCTHKFLFAERVKCGARSFSNQGCVGVPLERVAGGIPGIVVDSFMESYSNHLLTRNSTK